MSSWWSQGSQQMREDLNQLLLMQVPHQNSVTPKSSGQPVLRDVSTWLDFGMRSFYASRSKCMNAFQHQKASLNMLLTRVVQADVLLNIARCFSAKGFPTAPKEEEKPQKNYYKKLQASGETPEFGGTCAHTHVSGSLHLLLSCPYPIPLVYANECSFCQDIPRHSDIFMSEALVGVDIIDGTFIGWAQLSNTLLSSWTIICERNLTN